MIKAITSYQTEDGKRFPTREEAEKHQSCTPIVLELREITVNSLDHYSDIAAWILRNFERKELKRYQEYIADNGQRYKVEGSTVWMLDGGAWFESGILLAQAKEKYLSGKWREFKAE